MIRYLLGAMAALFVLRIFFEIARALTRSPEPSGSDSRGGSEPAGSKTDSRRGESDSRLKAETARERSRAIEVPFTEIPPEEPARRP